jgi:hypothetical protein
VTTRGSSYIRVVIHRFSTDTTQVLHRFFHRPDPDRGPPEPREIAAGNPLGEIHPQVGRYAEARTFGFLWNSLVGVSWACRVWCDFDAASTPGTVVWWRDIGIFFARLVWRA